MATTSNELTAPYYFIDNLVELCPYYPSSMDTTSNELTAPYRSTLVFIWALPLLLIILAIICSILAKKHYFPYMDTKSSRLAGIHPCSSSSSSSPPSWDVFLSFYGKDTRNNFTSHLYSALDQAGIQTFMDEPELQKGEEISQGLLNAIHGSKIFVIVLSKNYASSRWCLDELVEILTCYRTNGQVVIPVFYYVDPSDLRHHKGSFGDALDSHNKRYSVDIIEKWKSTLAEIAELSGYHLKTDANDKNESDIVQEIVEKLTPLISTKTLHLEEYLVGIDSSVEEIYQKLSMESNDVRAVGICGMGGIGKTTTAKAFYNKYSNNFDISCFVDDVKQHSQGGSPLLPLLNQLLIKLLGRKDYKVPDVVNGIRKLKQILSSKKALIVLDDLDQLSYSELLTRLCNLVSAGSRIIFTAKDTNLVNQLKEDIPGVDIYMVRELEHIDSLELFSYHAFRKPAPPESFRELSASFVTYAGGLPLALKVLGSSLRGRTEVLFWKEKLKKVRNIPEEEILEILRLSYDELDDETLKAIFLDVAFFFIGKDKDEAVHIFKSCGYFPDVGIPVLVERCLLTIDEDNTFQMHNLIQDMGREVIEESKHGNCRRLYLCEGNAYVALQNLEGTEKIEGLVIDQTMSTKRHLSAKIFERLPNLRLLEIIGAHDITGDFENSFHELRCIRWRHCPWTRLPSSFRPQNLVSLSMPSSKFKTLWKGATPSVNLKTIDLSYSMNLKTTPDFRDSKLIEKLKFRGCESLLKVHPSIGQLTSLSHLDLDGCENLKELPEPLRQLSKLGHLDLGGCVNLKRLPESIKQLTNLGSLNLRRCRNLKRLPEQLGDMKGLKMLDASYTAIEQLPDSIVLLKKLVELNLYKCKKIIKLPEQIGNMEGLRTFNARFTAIEQLPDTFVGLANLVNLHLGCCKNLASLPNSLWKLEFLRVLELDGSIKLKQLPGQLGKMQSLEKLTATGTSIEELPDSIGLLSRLQVLNLYCYNEIKYLPSSIWNLTSLAELRLDQKDMDGIVLPDTVKDMKLKSLVLRQCNISSWMPVILSLSSLEVLNLDDEGQSFSSSESYSLSKLSNLRDLTLQNCTSLDCLADLSSLKQLNRLCIWRCISLESLPPLPPHLKGLDVHGCTSLQDVPDLSMLKELEDLSFSGCSNLKSISWEQSGLQVTSKNYSYFRAELPNTEIPEWFSYKSSGSTVSFDIPPNLGENFFGVVLWIVYKYTDWRSYNSYYMRAVITNRTKGTKKDRDVDLTNNNRGVGVVQSRVECIGKHGISSGDRIKISFQSLLYYYDDDIGGKVPGGGEVKVMMCGAHLLLKTPPLPY